jgi:hypothetical protein
MTYGNELKTVLDFTSDRDLLIAAIKKFRSGNQVKMRRRPTLALTTRIKADSLPPTRASSTFSMLT